MNANITIKKNLNGYCVVLSPLKFKSNFKFSKVYDFKLENSISRAKNIVFDLVQNNYFEFFVTITINENHNRYDLSSLRKKFNSRVKYMRKKGLKDLFYILIPEHHKNGAWHFHGFFSSGFGEDMYINDNGYLSLTSFDSLGFTSISKINNYEACCKYVLKYINKDMCKGLKGKHLYFCSRGLKRSEKLCQFYSSDLQPLNFNFKNGYIKKSDIKYYNLITYIDDLINYNKIYYVVDDKFNFISQNLHLLQKGDLYE